MKNKIDHVITFSPFPNQNFIVTLKRSWFGFGRSGRVITKERGILVFYRHGFDSILFDNSFLQGVWKNTENSFWSCGWPGQPSGVFLSKNGKRIAFSKRMNYSRVKDGNRIEHSFYQVIIDKNRYFIKHITTLDGGVISGEFLLMTTCNNNPIGSFDYWHNQLKWEFFNEHSHVLFLIMVAYGVMRPYP